MFEPTGAVAPTTKMTDIATFLQLMRSMHNQSTPKENPKPDYAFDVAPNATSKAQDTDSFHAKINMEMMKWTVMKSDRGMDCHGTLQFFLEARQVGDQLTVQRKKERHFYSVMDNTLLCLAIPAHLAWYRLLCVLDGEYSVDMRDMSLDYDKVNIEMLLRHRATGTCMSVLQHCLLTPKQVNRLCWVIVKVEWLSSPVLPVESLKRM